MKSFSVILGGACLALTIGLPSMLRAEEVRYTPIYRSMVIPVACRSRELENRCYHEEAICISNCPKFAYGATCENNCAYIAQTCAMMACQ